MYYQRLPINQILSFNAWIWKNRDSLSFYAFLVYVTIPTNWNRIEFESRSFDHTIRSQGSPFAWHGGAYQAQLLLLKIIQGFTGFSYRSYSCTRAGITENLKAGIICPAEVLVCWPKSKTLAKRHCDLACFFNFIENVFGMWRRSQNQRKHNADRAQCQ